MGCEGRQAVVYKVMNLEVAKRWGNSQRCSWVQGFLDANMIGQANSYRSFERTHCFYPQFWKTYEYRGA